jgi:hypothetical protein
MESDERSKILLLVFHPVINTKLNAMKLLKILIRPILLEEICKELRHHGVAGMTVYRGKSTGRYVDPTKEHGSLDFPAMHAEVVKSKLPFRTNMPQKLRILFNRRLLLDQKETE